ncbi:hypothetical protein [Streptomyces sp. NRRL B-3648]|uniref:hypothetical protein n=1 Tax=Streptomyces sp. NRRL B-3648 TaxID=1519493 RepID=UPI000ABE5000
MRVTVVGGDVFCVRIDSDLLNRRTDYSRLAYTPVQPPTEIEPALHRFCGRFSRVATRPITVAGRKDCGL